MKRIGIIIGAGAAGLTAAISAAESGAEIIILEHTPKAGKKLLSTGNGKCNLTNLFINSSCYRCDNKNFPMNVLNKFTPTDTVAFFKNLGVVTTDKNGYVYPYSNQARTILDALLNRIDELGIKLITETEILSINKQKNSFLVETSSGNFSGDFLILCAGSAAAKNTGSDGSGYKLA